MAIQTFAQINLEQNFTPLLTIDVTTFNFERCDAIPVER